MSLRRLSLEACVRVRQSIIHSLRWVGDPTEYINMGGRDSSPIGRPCPSAVPVVGWVDVVTAKSARAAIGGKEQEAFVWGDVWLGDGNLRGDYVGSFRLTIFPVKSAL